MFSFNDSQVGIFKVFVILSFFTAKLHGRHNRALVTNKRRATIVDDFLSESTRRKKPNKGCDYKQGCDYERILTKAIRQKPLSDWEKDCICIVGGLCCDGDPRGCSQCKDCIYENKLLN